MKEIAAFIAIIMLIIFILISDEFRNVVIIGLLVYITYILSEIYRVLI